MPHDLYSQEALEAARARRREFAKWRSERGLEVASGRPLEEVAPGFEPSPEQKAARQQAQREEGAEC